MASFAKDERARLIGLATGVELVELKGSAVVVTLGSGRVLEYGYASPADAETQRAKWEAAIPAADALVTIDGITVTLAVTSLSPNTAVSACVGDFEVIVRGTGFVPGCVISRIDPSDNRCDLLTTYVSATELQCWMPTPADPPAPEVGKYDIVYTGSNGTVTLAEGFEFTAPPP